MSFEIILRIQDTNENETTSQNHTQASNVFDYYTSRTHFDVRWQKKYDREKQKQNYTSGELKRHTNQQQVNEIKMKMKKYQIE